MPSPDDVMLVALDETVDAARWIDRLRPTIVARLASALREAGVRPGDRVAAWMPNTLETMLLMLGSASVGAVFCSCSPDFGADGVLDRFGQIRPTVLVAADGYTYGGRSIDRREELDRIIAGLPTVRHLVVVPFLDDAPVLSTLSDR